jgi:fimbrial chaperone protein
MNERYRWKAAFFAAFLFIFGLAATGVFASMNISPVRVNLSADHDKDIIRITNQESSAKSYEVEVVGWTQTDERREVYTPTEDVLAVPPLFSLNPGEEQIIRVGLLTDTESSIERSYRLFITEIAPPEPQETRNTGVNMRLQIGVPVFVAPTGLPSASLKYVETTMIADQTYIRFENTGNSHVKVTEIQYSGPGIDEDTKTAAVAYILAGKSALLPIDLPNGRQVGTIRIVTENLGVMEYELPFVQ